MPTLLPFKDYDEHDVINLYACTTTASKGTLVKPTVSPNANPIDLSSDLLGAKYANTVNNPFNIVGRVEPVNLWSDVPTAMGMLLYDVKEEDENGQKLIFNPRKLAEVGAVLPIVHAAPILTKGIVLVNNIDTANKTIAGGGNPNIGYAAYVGDNGRIGTDGVSAIGKFLSTLDSNGFCLVKLDFK